MEVTLKKAALVSVNDGTIIVTKDKQNYTYKNASVKSVVDGNITIKVSNPYKKGDYLRIRIYNDRWVTLVYKGYDSNQGNIHFFVSNTDGGYTQDNYWSRSLVCNSEDIRYATIAEILEFNDLLHSHGKHWNTETFQLENYFWKPRIGFPYYYISSSAQIHDTTNDGCPADKDMIAIGNCFKTKKEAEQYLAKFKEVFKR
jgi:hypothetical protein